MKRIASATTVWKKKRIAASRGSRIRMKTRAIVPVVIIASCVALFAPASARAAIYTGLQGYWKFDNNFLDSSGNGYDLTPVGNPPFRSDGVMGQALDLPGNNSQYAHRTVDDAAFNFAASDFTIQVWANFRSVDSTGTVFIEKFDGGNGPGWTLDRPVGTTDTLEFFAQVAGGTQAIDKTVTFSTDSWHQIVARRLGDTISLFYDGISIGSEAFTGSIDPTTNPLLVGTRNANDGRDISMNGGLDETAIWNRGLSDAEIAALYNNGAGLDITPVPEPSTWLAPGIVAMFLAARFLRAGRARNTPDPCCGGRSKLEDRR